MAQQQLSEHGKAVDTLDKGIDVIETRMRSLKNGDIGDAWIDWIIVQTLRKEADALIENRDGGRQTQFKGNGTPSKHGKRRPLPSRQRLSGLLSPQFKAMVKRYEADGVARAGNHPILPGRKRGHALRPVEFLQGRRDLSHQPNLGPTRWGVDATELRDDNAGRHQGVH